MDSLAPHGNAFTGGIISPAMIAALQTLTLNHTLMKWNLTMRATVFKGKEVAGFRSHQDDRITSKENTFYGPIF